MLLAALYSVVNGEIALFKPGAALAISRILTIATTQMGLAQIETAENTYAIYQLIKNLPNNFNSLKPSVRQAIYLTIDLKEGVRRIKVYKDVKLMKGEEGVVVGDETFANVIEAEKWITSQQDV